MPDTVDQLPTSPGTMPRILLVAAAVVEALWIAALTWLALAG